MRARRIPNLGVKSIALTAFLIAMVATATRADDPSQDTGTLDVSVTERQNDGTVRPLAGVDLEVLCDRAMRFPPMRTDVNGKATIHAAHADCKLTARSAAKGGASYLWTWDVSFSKKPAKLELSTDDAVMAPVILHNVDPKYPDELRAAGIGGSVFFETVIRRDGTVGKVRVLGSSNKGFNQSVIAAVSERKYKPALKKGWPVAVTLTERIDFELSTRPVKLSEPDEPIAPTEDVVLPILVAKVEPDFPSDARLARISGTVRVRAVIDKQGDVTDTSVLNTTNPVFNEAAMKAVKLRKYKPATKDGKPVAIYFTIRIDFGVR